jgi:hypothetical protein
MKKFLSFVVLVSILLTSCTLSKSTPTTSPAEIATQVNKLLTAIPTVTGIPAALSTATQPVAIPTATQAATAMPAPTNTVPPPPTATLAPSATATLAPSATLALTSTIPATDPTLKYGQPTFVDTFKNDLNWPTGENQFTSIEIKDGVLKMTALTAIDGWRLTWPSASNSYAEISVKSDNCTGSDHYGLVFRVPDIKLANQGYFYGITCDGKYFINKWAGAVQTVLAKETANKNILVGPNQINRLGILASGSSLVAYVNGVKLVEVSDSKFTKGAFGLFLGSKTTKNLDILVNKVSYWENP